MWIYFQSLAVDGKDGFYKGRIAKAIADIVQSNGGVLSVEDMEQHETTFDNPIKVTYKGINVWEMPPNGQGITALLALNLLKGIDTKGYWLFIYVVVYESEFEFNNASRYGP